VQASALLTNIRLGWLGSSLYNVIISDEQKEFNLLTDGVNVTKLIFFITDAVAK
jgi:hypothetical protein